MVAVLMSAFTRERDSLRPPFLKKSADEKFSKKSRMTPNLTSNLRKISELITECSYGNRKSLSDGRDEGENGVKKYSTVL